LSFYEGSLFGFVKKNAARDKQWSRNQRGRPEGAGQCECRPQPAAYGASRCAENKAAERKTA
jgi:hypothetical protein